jgi:WD40 repeat protein
MITFYENAGAILSVAFINNGRHILAGGYDGSIRMWNTQRPTELPIVFSSNRDRLVNTIAVHPTGWFISAGRDGKMNIWYEMMGSVQLHRVLTHHEDGKMNQSVTCVSFSPSGETFASGGNDGIVIIWDSEKLKKVTQIIHYDETKYVPAFQIGVTAIVYIDEKQFVSGGVDGRVCLWSIDGNFISVIEAKNTTVNSLAFTPTNYGILAVAYEKWGQGNLVLFDRTGKQQLQSLDVGLAPKSVVFGRYGRIISGGTGGFLVILSNARSEYATEQVAALREGIAQSNPAMPPNENFANILVRLPERAQEDVLKFVGGKQTKRKQTQTRKKRTSKRR